MIRREGVIRLVFPGSLHLLNDWIRALVALLGYVSDSSYFMVDRLR